MSKEQSVDSLEAFFNLMEWTRDIRCQIVNQLMSSLDCQKGQIDSLKSALESLKGCLKTGYMATLEIGDSNKIDMDLTYEVTELEKDICFLENGEENLITYMDSLHSGFFSHVQSGVEALSKKRFNCFITDRDGTINNYCGRYRSSIQSIYNALFLVRFANNCTSNSIIITSAPLEDIGIMDVSILPEKTIVYAASKGREFIDLSGKRRSLPIDDDKQALINRLNHELSNLVIEPDYEIFSLIGSGLQFKFGQTTIARQDTIGSIDMARSDAFLAIIKNIVKILDPTGDNFRIEDTGLDIEIILTISNPKNGLKDFDKGDAIQYLDEELNLHMGNGPNLICGDTESDIPMLEAAMDKSKNTWSIFVTKNKELADCVEAVCPNAIIVPEPDILIKTLNQVAL